MCLLSLKLLNDQSDASMHAHSHLYIPHVALSIARAQTAPAQTPI